MTSLGSIQQSDARLNVQEGSETYDATMCRHAHAVIIHAGSF